MGPPRRLPHVGQRLACYLGLAVVLGFVGGVIGAMAYSQRHCGSPGANCGLETVSWAFDGGFLAVVGMVVPAVVAEVVSHRRRRR